MVELEKIISPAIKDAVSTITGTEDMVIQAIQELVKDEIKKYIKQKIEEDPELKKEIMDAVETYMEAKIKEGYAALKLTKAGAKLGIKLIPQHLREEMTKEIVKIFEDEIAAVMDKTM